MKLIILGFLFVFTSSPSLIDTDTQCSRSEIRRGGDCVAIADATDDEIRQLIIRRSIASYSGNCPCPYNTDRAGRRCGGRSAYSRRGGASPVCYASQVSDAQVQRVRDQYTTAGGR